MSRTFLTGGTPLDPDESEGLIPSHVSTQAELNRVEQANILEAVTWATSRKHSRLLTDEFIRELHRRMFKDVWKWAGLYRRTLKNFGVPPETIPVEVKKLCEDTHYWVQNKVFPWDELAARFHHRLVAIHPFPNGSELISSGLLSSSVLVAVMVPETGAWKSAEVLTDSITPISSPAS